MIGTYASVKFNSAQGELLKLWCDSRGIPMSVTPDSLHTTLIYSRTHVEPIDFSLNKIFLIPKEFRIFESHSERVLVMILDSPELNEMHDQLIDAGGTHDYPIYYPHITLSYQVSKNCDISKFQIPPLVFIPTHLRYEPLNDDWSI